MPPEEIKIGCETPEPEVKYKHGCGLIMELTDLADEDITLMTYDKQFRWIGTHEEFQQNFVKA